MFFEKKEKTNNISESRSKCLMAIKTPHIHINVFEHCSRAKKKSGNKQA